MRGLVLAGVGEIEVHDDLPDPVVEDPGDAVVAIHLAGLCGSDLHPWAGREPFRPGVVPGHEAVGEVVAVGDAVTSVAVGDRVVIPFTTSCGTCEPCRAGLSARCTRGRLFGWGDPDGTTMLHGMQAEAVRVPDADGTLLVLPNRFDDATGVLLADNVPTGWYAAERADIRAGDAVAVLGCGTVGLCAIVALHAQGARPVLASDPVAGRRDRAARLGARACQPDELAEVVAGATDGVGVAAVVDAVGTPATFATAAHLVRPGGTVQVVAVPADADLRLTPVEAYDRNLTLRFGRAPVRSLLPTVLDAVADGRLRLPSDHVVTGRPLPLAAGPEAYAQAADPTDRTGKLTFDPRLESGTPPPRLRAPDGGASR